MFPGLQTFAGGCVQVLQGKERDALIRVRGFTIRWPRTVRSSDKSQVPRASATNRLPFWLGVGNMQPEGCVRERWAPLFGPSTTGKWDPAQKSLETVSIRRGFVRLFSRSRPEPVESKG